MAKRGIRIRINSQRVAALLEICDEMIEDFCPANEHQHLLKEYLHELKERLWCQSKVVITAGRRRAWIIYGCLPRRHASKRGLPGGGNTVRTDLHRDPPNHFAQAG